MRLARVGAAALSLVFTGAQGERLSSTASGRSDDRFAEVSWRRSSDASRRRGAAVQARTLLALLAASAPAARAEAPFTLEALDDNNDGVVDLVEFMLHTRDELDAEGLQEKKLRKGMFRMTDSLYKYCDCDGDGVLDGRELAYAAYMAEIASLAAERRGQELADFLIGDSETQFRIVDRSRDGLIDSDEFKRAVVLDLQAWGFDENWIQSAEANQWLEIVFNGGDKDGNGYLDDVSEMRHAGFLLFDGGMEAMAHVYLRDLDANSDGKVDWMEVMQGARSNSDRQLILSQQVRSGFSAADLDRDGSLNSTEMQRLCASIIARAFVDAAMR